MKTADEIRYSVIVLRLDVLQRQHDEAIDRLNALKQLSQWIDWEMSELWIEKAALERRGDVEYPQGTVFS